VTNEPQTGRIKNLVGKIYGGKKYVQPIQLWRACSFILMINYNVNSPMNELACRRAYEISQTEYREAVSGLKGTAILSPAGEVELNRESRSRGIV